MHHTRTHIPYSVSLTFCLSVLARLDIASTKIAKKKIRLALPHTHVFVYMGVNAACKPWPIETKMGNGTENWPTVSSLFGQYYVKIIPGKRDNQLSGCKGFSSTSTSFFSSLQLKLKGVSTVAVCFGMKLKIYTLLET